MDYELAKQLKDAGFPQKEKGTLLFADGITMADSQKKWNENSAYSPSLEELIDACGDEFGELGKGNATIDSPWTASGLPVKIGFCGQGKTPTEAVARLWLEINK